MFWIGLCWTIAFDAEKQDHFRSRMRGMYYLLTMCRNFWPWWPRHGLLRQGQGGAPKCRREYANAGLQYFNHSLSQSMAGATRAEGGPTNNEDIKLPGNYAVAAILEPITLVELRMFWQTVYRIVIESLHRSRLLPAPSRNRLAGATPGGGGRRSLCTDILASRTSLLADLGVRFAGSRFVRRFWRLG